MGLSWGGFGLKVLKLLIKVNQVLRGPVVSDYVTWATAAVTSERALGSFMTTLTRLCLRNLISGLVPRWWA